MHQVLGVLLVGVLIGGVAEMMAGATASAARAQTARVRMAGVSAWMAKRCLPPQIQRHIRVRVLL